MVVSVSITQSKAFEFEGLFLNKFAKPTEELQEAFRTDSGAILTQTIIESNHYHCVSGVSFLFSIKNTSPFQNKTPHSKMKLKMTEFYDSSFKKVVNIFRCNETHEMGRQVKHKKPTEP